MNTILTVILVIIAIGLWFFLLRPLIIYSFIYGVNFVFHTHWEFSYLQYVVLSFLIWLITLMFKKGK